MLMPRRRYRDFQMDGEKRMNNGVWATKELAREKGKEEKGAHFSKEINKINPTLSLLYGLGKDQQKQFLWKIDL